MVLRMQPLEPQRTNNEIVAGSTASIGFFDLPKELRDMIYFMSGLLAKSPHDCPMGYIPTLSHNWHLPGRHRHGSGPRCNWCRDICPRDMATLNMMQASKQMYHEIMDLHYGRSWFTFKEPDELMCFARCKPFSISHIYLLSLAITGSPVEWAMALNYAAFRNLKRLRVWSFYAQDRPVHPDLWRALVGILTDNSCFLQIFNFNLTDDQQDEVSSTWDIKKRVYKLPERAIHSKIGAGFFSSPATSDQLS